MASRDLYPNGTPPLCAEPPLAKRAHEAARGHDRCAHTAPTLLPNPRKGLSFAALTLLCIVRHGQSDETTCTGSFAQVRAF